MDQTSQDLQKRAQDNDPSSVRADRDYRSSEEWRAICEAQYVLSKPVAWRRQYLEDVGRIRGAAGRAYIERVIRQEWEKRKAPAKGG